MVVLSTCTWLSIVSGSLSILFTTSEILGVLSSRHGWCSSISESLYRGVCYCCGKKEKTEIVRSNTFKLKQIQKERG